ncbi:MAG: hypothetical protein FJ313_06975, partial [Gemmatimonadetes bacterium]|nr:hypothetical protein [Gemmatimonadota bacterium]
MRGTDVTPHGEGHKGGLSPAMWAIILAAVTIGIGYLLGEQTWVTPHWSRWWLPVLGTELALYALTLFIPPVGRLTLAHGVARVGVGFGMRLVVVLVCAAIRTKGGDTTFLDGVKVYWAGHWLAALGEIACVAAAVYWFRYLSVQRIQRARAAHQEAIPALLDPAGLSRDELLGELAGPIVVSREAEVAVAEPSPAVAVAEPRIWPPRVIVPEPLREAPTPPPAPEVEALAEPAAAAPAAFEEIDALSLPAEAVVRLLPAAMVNRSSDSAALDLEAGELRVSWKEIEPQLSLGEVRVGALELLSQLPPTVLAGPPTRLADQLPEGVLL